MHAEVFRNAPLRLDPRAEPHMYPIRRSLIVRMARHCAQSSLAREATMLMTQRHALTAGLVGWLITACHGGSSRQRGCFWDGSTQA
jgi:hypothetical protein